MKKKQETFKHLIKKVLVFSFCVGIVILTLITAIGCEDAADSKQNLSLEEKIADPDYVLTDEEEAQKEEIEEMIRQGEVEDLGIGSNDYSDKSEDAYNDSIESMSEDDVGSY